MSGVGNSINFLKKNSSKVTDLLTKTSNDDMLIELANFAQGENSLKSFHCFPFGGFEKTCLWLKNLPNLKPTKIVKPDIVLVNGKKMSRMHYESFKLP